MNEHLISNDSLIYGKSKIYKPDDVIYRNDKFDNPFLNCIVIFSFLHLDRFNFKVEFYEQFTQEDFDSSDRQHICLVIYTTKEKSKAIIEDIKKGKNFTQ